MANCICRQKTERYAARCARTDLKETCLILGPDHARRYVDIGIGRFITREEIFDILAHAAEDGLVVQPENSQQPEAICLCCGDCCVLLVPMKQHPRPADLFISNYHVTNEGELCIGCGACLAVCAVGANELHKKSEEWVPFDDKDSWFMRIQSVREGR